MSKTFDDGYYDVQETKKELKAITKIDEDQEAEEIENKFGLEKPKIDYGSEQEIQAEESASENESQEKNSKPIDKPEDDNEEEVIDTISKK